MKTRVRKSAPWFHAECHSAKSTTRRLEKAYRLKRAPSALATWKNQFDGKYSKYWSETISSCHGDYKTMWSKLQPLLKLGPVTFSSERWWLRSSFHRQDWSYPCVNRRVAITCDHRPTHCGTAVPPSTHVRRLGDGHPKEVGGELKHSQLDPVVGKTRLWCICTYHLRNV